MVWESLAYAVRKENKARDIYWEGGNNSHWQMMQFSNWQFIKMRAHQAAKINRQIATSPFSYSEVCGSPEGNQVYFQESKIHLQVSDGWNLFLKRFYLFIHERHTERGRDTGRRRSRLPVGTPSGTRSQDQHHALSWSQTLNHWATQVSSFSTFSWLFWCWFPCHWESCWNGSSLCFGFRTSVDAHCDRWGRLSCTHPSTDPSIPTCTYSSWFNLPSMLLS